MFSIFDKKSESNTPKNDRVEAIKKMLRAGVPVASLAKYGYTKEEIAEATGKPVSTGKTT